MTKRLILFASLALAAAGVAGAQELYVLDHFTCYITPNHPTVTLPIFLVDGFSTAGQDVNEIQMTMFCNPATKRVVNTTGTVTTITPATPVAHPDAHLAMYVFESTPEYNSPAVVRSVNVNNQFGKQNLTTFYADYLAVPSGKELFTPTISVTLPVQPAQSELDHFMCYAAQGNSIGATVLLNDEFFNSDHTEVASVLAPQFLCNPAQKTVLELTSRCTTNICPADTTPVNHPTSYLVCYHTLTASTFTGTILYTNQFVPPGSIASTPVSNLYLLCVPSQLVNESVIQAPSAGGGE